MLRVVGAELEKGFVPPVGVAHPVADALTVHTALHGEGSTTPPTCNCSADPATCVRGYRPTTSSGTATTGLPSLHERIDRAVVESILVNQMGHRMVSREGLFTALVDESHPVGYLQLSFDDRDSIMWGLLVMNLEFEGANVEVFSAHLESM